MCCCRQIASSRMEKKSAEKKKSINRINKALENKITHFRTNLAEKRLTPQKRKIMTSIFNYDFITSIIPRIVQIHNQCFTKIPEEGGKKKLQPLQAYALVYAHIIIKCFFGCSKVEDQIDGMNIAEYANTLVDDINEQGFDPIAILAGAGFLELGIREKDRNVKKRV